MEKNCINLHDQGCDLPIPDFVEEKVLDIRAPHKLEGSSGAENFFCDETDCIIEKDKQLCMAGVQKELGSQISRIISEHIVGINNEASVIRKASQSIEDQQRKLIYLLQELGYSHIRINKDILSGYFTVSVAKNHMEKEFRGPPIF